MMILKSKYFSVRICETSDDGQSGVDVDHLSV